MGNKHKTTKKDNLPKSNNSNTLTPPNVGLNTDNNNDNITITLSKSQKAIKRNSTQLLELFDGSININTTTFSYKQQRQLFVIDIVPLSHHNHKQKTLILICGNGVMEGYIINFKNNKINYIYFENKSDDFSKVDSIAIHSNNKYLCLQCNNIIKIYNMDIDYENLEFIKLSRAKNISVINLKYLKKTYSYWMRYSTDNILFLSDENGNLNELLLIKQQDDNPRDPHIFIYNFTTKSLLYEFEENDNLSQNKMLYSSFRDIKINTMYYDRKRKYLILIRLSCWIEIYDVSKSQNNKVVVNKIISYKDDTDHQSNYQDEGIQIVSLSPNGKYLLTSPKNIDWMDNVGLNKPFNIYKVNYDENKLELCNFISDNINEYERDYNYEFDSKIEYDSDVSRRYQDSGCDYPYDHQSFEWLTNNTFVYVIDELNGHHHFGELVIVSLDNYILMEEHKICIIETVRDKYNIIILRDIVDLIGVYFEGIVSMKFQKQHIHDHGYRHPKNEIVHCGESKLFVVCGIDRSIRIHKYF